ncbi:hypothetical protein Tco_1465972 [Tanacetum coccineum]
MANNENQVICSPYFLQFYLYVVNVIFMFLPFHALTFDLDSPMAMKQRKRENNLMNWKWDAVIVIEDSDDEVHGRTNVQPRGAREPPWKISPFTSAITSQRRDFVQIGSVKEACPCIKEVMWDKVVNEYVTFTRGLGMTCVCVDLDWDLTLAQTEMVDFVPGRAVIDAAQRKRGKYMAKCAAIGYGFLPFSFSSLKELEADAVTLLKRVRKFSMTQDIGARAAAHIFNMISFAIAK